MKVNLSCLSALSKHFENQKKLKKLNSKLPDNYISPFKRKKSIEPYCYLNKEGMKEENIKSQRHDKFLLSQFLQKLSKTDKQIEKERKDYLNSLKYYNGETEKMIKLKNIERINNIAINRKLENLLDLRKYKLKYENNKRDIIYRNNNIFNINNSNNKNEKMIFMKKFIRPIKLTSRLTKRRKFDIINKNDDITNNDLNFPKTPSRNNNSNRCSNNSLSTYLSFKKKLEEKNLSNDKNNSINNLKEKNPYSKYIINKENNKEKNINKNSIISYEKKWNSPKSFNFNKILGRDEKKEGSFKFKRFEEFRFYNPNYESIYPNSKKNIVLYDKSSKINFNKYKIISTRKTIYNYINKNYSFDDNYNIMNIIKLEKEKKKNKIDKLKHACEFFEYLKFKKILNKKDDSLQKNNL